VSKALSSISLLADRYQVGGWDEDAEEEVVPARPGADARVADRAAPPLREGELPMR
jgi:hypothetical protein